MIEKHPDTKVSKGLKKEEKNSKNAKEIGCKFIQS